MLGGGDCIAGRETIGDGLREQDHACCEQGGESEHPEVESLALRAALFGTAGLPESVGDEGDGESDEIGLKLGGCEPCGPCASGSESEGEDRQAAEGSGSDAAHGGK